MIANEIISAAASSEQLPRQVKDSIRYTLYEAQRDQLNRVQKICSNKLADQHFDSNQQNPRQLPEVLSTIGEQDNDILGKLRERAFFLNAFNAFLDYHIGSERMMVALHDVKGNGQENPSNYISIDAIAHQQFPLRALIENGKI